MTKKKATPKTVTGTIVIKDPEKREEVDVTPHLTKLFQLLEDVADFTDVGTTNYTFELSRAIDLMGFKTKPGVRYCWPEEDELKKHIRAALDAAGRTACDFMLAEFFADGNDYQVFVLSKSAKKAKPATKRAKK
jgi:hypothetical protein